MPTRHSKRRSQNGSGQAHQVTATATRLVLDKRLGVGHSVCSHILIDPRNSKHMWIWDIVSSVSLVFVALVTPVEVGFLEPASSLLDVLFLINQAVNAIFLMDLFLQFFLKVTVTDKLGTRTISDPRLIAKRYIFGWFPIDVMSVAVASVDFISIASEHGNGDLDNLRTLRILRALRLIKLSKLLTGQRILKRWETKVAINYAAISLFKCLIGMLLVSHWFACIWGMQASLESSKMHTWLGSFDLCTIDNHGNETCKGPGYQYSAAIYWAVMTMTSIGYGDISATPGNVSEQIVCTFVMTLGAICWGMVLGTIVGNLSNLDPEGDQFASTMTELNRMMSREGLNTKLQVRLREYFQQTLHIRQTQRRSQLLNLMSPTLRAEVSWECNKEWLGNVWFLSGSSHAFLVQVSSHLEPEVYAPNESIPPGKMYIMHRGVVLCGGKIFSRGKVWGEDMILTSERLRLPHCGTAMTFTSLFSLKRGDLGALAEEFPYDWHNVRRHAAKLAVRRAFVLMAKLQKAKREEGIGDLDVEVDLVDASFTSIYSPGATAKRPNSSCAEPEPIFHHFSQEAQLKHVEQKDAVMTYGAASSPGKRSAGTDCRDERSRTPEPPSNGLLQFFSTSITPTTPLVSGRSAVSGDSIESLRPILGAILAEQKRVTKELIELKSSYSTKMSKQDAELAIIRRDVVSTKQLAGEHALAKVMAQLNA